MSSSYIKDNKISISAEQWQELNLNHSKDYLIEMLSDLMEGLPLPYREITEEEAYQDYLNLCKQGSSALIKKGSFYSRYTYKYPFSDVYIDSSNVGNKSSDFYHLRSRWLCDSINSPSPFRVWTIPKFRKSLLNSLWSLKVQEVNNNVLRSCMGLRKYIASQFRPSAAKAIYEHFNAEHVLDFSSGWGDRHSAFHAASCTKTYVGVDPNQTLFEGYAKQQIMYNSDKDVEFINAAAEDVDFNRFADKFDMIFTSPCYYIIERYTNEPNQAWVRYKKLQDWLDKFLFAVINNTYCTLKKGGILAINISDVYCNHTVNLICNPMLKFAESLGYKYIGAYGLRMAKRPNSKAVGGGIFGEPIWILQKQ